MNGIDKLKMVHTQTMRDQLQTELDRCLMMREMLGETVNGVKQPWTGLDAEIVKLRDLIFEVELELSAGGH